MRAWTPDDPSTQDRRKLAVQKGEECEKAGRKFAGWFVRLFDDDYKQDSKEYDVTRLTTFQLKLAETAACVMKNIILPEWQQDPSSMLRSADGKELQGKLF